MVKTFKTLLRNQKADDIETWYAAFGTQVVPNLSKLWHWVYLDTFDNKVKFGPFYLCMGNRLNCRLMKSMRWKLVHIVKWVHDNLWLSRVKVIHWPLSKVTQIQHFQTSCPQKPLGRLKPNFIWSLHGMWGMKICSNVPGHMTMPIYGKELQRTGSDLHGWKLICSIECSCISKFVLIQYSISTQVSDTGPLVLWIINWLCTRVSLRYEKQVFSCHLWVEFIINMASSSYVVMQKCSRTFDPPI